MEGLILLQTHLSHTSTGLAALPRGGLGGSCAFLVQWCHAGLPVVLQQSAPPLLTVQRSLGKSSLPAPSPLNTQSSCPCVCVRARVCVYQSRHWLLQQFLSTNEHQLNENRKAMHSINIQKNVTCLYAISPMVCLLFGMRWLFTTQRGAFIFQFSDLSFLNTDVIWCLCQQVKAVFQRVPVALSRPQFIKTTASCCWRLFTGTHTMAVSLWLSIVWEGRWRKCQFFKIIEAYFPLW